jgi:adenine-specific DNA-methyltransferase
MELCRIHLREDGGGAAEPVLRAHPAKYGRGDLAEADKGLGLRQGNRGDLVLDSFLGSGTTAAVAHKMGRRWIGIELGEHAVTHCAPRLCKVIDGEDPGGITESTGWKGGGGFRFLRLAPSLLEKDKWGNWVISKRYNAPMLAEALCKLEGFRYEPDPEVFWMHGRATEAAYLYVTDQMLTAEQLEYLSSQVGPDRHLAICCAAWRGDAERYPNLTLKKIPQAVLAKCEWGRDDYSLNVEALTPAPAGRGGAAKKAKKQRSVQELPLFAGLEPGGES